MSDDRITGAKFASRVLAALIGIVIVAIGIVGVVAPRPVASVASAARTALTLTSLYAIAVLRVLIGAVFLLCASVSRMPATLRVLGVVVIVAGITTPLFGLDRSRAVINWVIARDLSFIRTAGIIAAAFGGFLIYATRSAHRTS
jgi:hypothetical protein